MAAVVSKATTRRAQKKRLWVALFRCCAYCGINSDLVKMTLDHIHPRVGGGRASLDNLLPACSRCNETKGRLYLTEWIARGGPIPYSVVCRIELARVRLHDLDRRLVNALLHPGAFERIDRALSTLRTNVARYGKNAYAKGLGYPTEGAA